MHYIALPDEKKRILPFYLAMEEYVAYNIDEDDCFFMWQVEPTVIFGRNQLIENEVNISYCKEHDIQMYRRKSGGGCVYSDMSNLMLSYITKDDNVNFTYNRYTNLIVLMLLKLNIEATSNGRNDIMIGNKKLSGNAFYHVSGRNIVHGTLLYDTDIENMTNAITPSNEKLTSKGVQSVRQHIALLKDYTPLSLEDVKHHIRHSICKDEIMLTNDDVRKIEDIMQEYLTEDFIYGKNPSYTLKRRRRIENVGEFEIQMELKNNIIKKINIMGDFFLIGDIDRKILSPLKGVRLERQQLEEVLPDDMENIIMNLKKDELINIITE